MEKKVELMWKLIGAWTYRALGKTSHAGFKRCINEILEYVIMLKELVGTDKARLGIIQTLAEISNLHFKKPLYKILDEVKGIVSLDDVDGTMPTIERLEGELEYEEYIEYLEI